jgi:hypothetical protein
LSWKNNTKIQNIFLSHFIFIKSELFVIHYFIITELNREKFQVGWTLWLSYCGIESTCCFADQAMFYLVQLRIWHFKIKFLLEQMASNKKYINALFLTISFSCLWKFIKSIKSWKWEIIVVVTLKPRIKKLWKLWKPLIICSFVVDVNCL